MSIPACSFPIRPNVINPDIGQGSTAKIIPRQWNETFNAYDAELFQTVEVSFLSKTDFHLFLGV